MLVAISSSGNSPNIISAIEAAIDRRGDILSFTGFGSDNVARRISTHSVYVPCGQYGIVESIHNLMLQQVVDEMGERKSV